MRCPCVVFFSLCLPVCVPPPSSFHCARPHVFLFVPYSTGQQRHRGFAQPTTIPAEPSTNRKKKRKEGKEQEETLGLRATTLSVEGRTAMLLCSCSQRRQVNFRALRNLFLISQFYPARPPHRSSQRQNTFVLGAFIASGLACSS